MTVAENPYRAPNASLEVVNPEKTDEGIAKKIRNAWICGLISAGVTIVFILIAVFGGKNFAGIDAWSIGDVVLILGLTYGIYRKSRTCAVLLFAYFVLSKILMWSASGKPDGLLLALVFMWYYAQGIAGTFAYHKLQRED
jgi:hypothetical protein